MPKPYSVQDKFFLEAKAKGYRARSAFKLLEIQDKFHILKAGQSVIDLGAAPGSFLQVISKIIGKDGRSLGIDLKNIEPIPHVEFIEGDILNTENLINLIRDAGFEKVDVLTSDLAPNTSGIRDLDQGRSIELSEQAFIIACSLLKKGGTFVAKVFQGEDFPFFLKRIKEKFKKVSIYKPKASRDRSFETYVVALGYLK